ncbi:UDP-glucose dehydrogenase family protein [Sporofaciens musculi]|uniref:UDP-glucose dehydrogenase family protein n=1 Tax=Sporofaciens musculi TaxID=2681861 RepID=UPI002570210A|nr:nucleotide sugar dehydrogenase [Sporofaciens musculi]
MVITVFGLGFVGLTTAVGFAEKGIKVYGIDVNEERTAVIREGRLPFFEPGLDEALVRNLNKTFFVTENVMQAVAESDCIYYCVGTPYGEGGQADLTYLYSAVESTLSGIQDEKFRVLVTKSTIPPSTTKEKIVPFVEEKGFQVGRQIGIANNPEFLREGYCWDDFMNADRIVLGISDSRSEEILRRLYAGFDIPVFAVSLNTGEFIKYLSNTLLATLISYSNEMSVMADTVGDIDVAGAFRILHMDKRWGGCSMTSYVYPGCGYGGYCLPKDTNAIYSLVKSKGFDAGILHNVIQTNERMPEFIAERIEKNIQPDSCIGILGLSFKPGSDDVRDTPAAKVIRKLAADGYRKIAAYDPIAEGEFKKYYPDIELSYCTDMESVIEKADELVILTAWEEFKKLNEMTDKPIIDCRYML